MQLTEIGQLIRLARKQEGLSQTALAAPLGMSRATISALENGTLNELGIRKLMAICGALKLSVSVAPQQGYPTYQELLKARQLGKE